MREGGREGRGRRGSGDEIGHLAINNLTSADVLYSAQLTPLRAQYSAHTAHCTVHTARDSVSVSIG